MSSLLSTFVEIEGKPLCQYRGTGVEVFLLFQQGWEGTKNVNHHQIDARILNTSKGIGGVNQNGERQKKGGDGGYKISYILPEGMILTIFQGSFGCYPIQKLDQFCSMLEEQFYNESGRDI